MFAKFGKVTYIIIGQIEEDKPINNKDIMLKKIPQKPAGFFHNNVPLPDHHLRRSEKVSQKAKDRRGKR